MVGDGRGKLVAHSLSTLTSPSCFQGNNLIHLDSLDSPISLLIWHVHAGVFPPSHIQNMFFLLCLSCSVGLWSKRVVTAFGNSSLNRCQLLEVSLSAWSALNIEITTLQVMNMELFFSELLIGDITYSNQYL